VSKHLSLIAAAVLTAAHANGRARARGTIKRLKAV
jgi:hypothetical protein